MSRLNSPVWECHLRSFSRHGVSRACGLPTIPVPFPAVPVWRSCLTTSCWHAAAISRGAARSGRPPARYWCSPEPVEDLIQVGYIGLLKAINNYDPAFGNGLRAYAAPSIGGEIKRHFRDKRWQIHVSRSVQELLLAMRDAVEDLTHELGRQPADGELAARLGVAVGD